MTRLNGATKHRIVISDGGGMDLVPLPKPKRGRAGKPKRFEILAHGGRIGRFSAADEAAAKEEFEKIVPVQFRKDCEWREMK